MNSKNMWKLTAMLVIMVMVVSACATPAATTQPTAKPAATSAPAPTTAPAPTSAPAATSAAAPSFEIPDIEQGKFNIGMVLIGPHNDGGWSQAHFEGLDYVSKNVPNVHVAYIENVPEGADSEQVFRSLGRKGFDLILGTSFGYMDPMETVAAEFPDQTFVHISGYKANGTNFGNLFGAMEDMKYLGGMLAGARAKKDGNPKLGYMATFPIPEELRLGNAFARGMKKTCPECTMDVRWINTWHDPVAEKDAAASLFDGGAQVVLTGADTPAVADVAQAKGKWGITYDYKGSCKVERCLTTLYWNWGPIYAKIVQGLIAKTYKPGFDYFDADSGSLGLFGFMEGEQLTKGVSDLDPAVIQQVKDTLAQMLAGKFNRFDVFAGEVKDNKGNVVVPAGQKMVQADLDQFPPGAPGLACKYCMYWWADGITAELPKL
jgi:basic membrane protein A